MSVDREQRFWQGVNAEGGPDACWPWMRGRYPTGYGQVRYGGRNAYTHRMAWLFTYRPLGPLPPWAVICHTCDNPPCCNPRHLFLGTHADNIADRDAKGRTARGFTVPPERRATGARHGSRTHPERFAHLGAKLTEEDAAHIRERRAAGVSRNTLAAEYGVSPKAIWRVTAGRSWAVAR